MLVSSSEVSAQQLTVGEKSNEDIQVRIDKNGTAHVIHIVQGNSYFPVHVETISGNMTNFSVIDSDNNIVQYFSIQKIPMTILIPPSGRNITLIRYDLPNTVSLNDGVWQWKYLTPSDAPFTDFYFPDKTDTIWDNDRPVYLNGHGIREYGDVMRLEYIIDEPQVLQDTHWQNYTFTVAVRTLSDIKKYAFDQQSMQYSIDIAKPNSFVTVIMPQSMLGGKYVTHINNNHLLTNVFHKNGTHTWIGVRPSTNGTVQIIGTTVIPEFPEFVPLFIGIIIILVFQFRTRLFWPLN